MKLITNRELCCYHPVTTESIWLLTVIDRRGGMTEIRGIGRSWRLFVDEFVNLPFNLL